MNILFLDIWESRKRFSVFLSIVYGLDSILQYQISAIRVMHERKSNQIISSTPLYPIPVLSEPFERLIIDCVGPLLRS